MARYLLRVANQDGYTPKDVEQVAEMIRKTLGSREAASHFRVSAEAIEFNMFARSDQELGDRKKLLRQRSFRIVSLRLLDTPPKVVDKKEALAEGIQLFNEERFWECHESLEQAWHVSKGVERDAIQSMILTAAAFVHHQKGEDEICLSILKRARAKLASVRDSEIVDLQVLEKNIDGILVSEKVQPFKLRINDV